MEQVDKLLGGDVLCGELCRKNGASGGSGNLLDIEQAVNSLARQGHLVLAAAVLHADGGDGPERVVKINFFPTIALRRACSLRATVRIRNLRQSFAAHHPSAFWSERLGRRADGGTACSSCATGDGVGLWYG